MLEGLVIFGVVGIFVSRKFREVSVSFWGLSEDIRGEW